MVPEAAKLKSYCDFAILSCNLLISFDTSGHRDCNYSEQIIKALGCSVANTIDSDLDKQANYIGNFDISTTDKGCFVNYFTSSSFETDFVDNFSLCFEFTVKYYS